MKSTPLLAQLDHRLASSGDRKLFHYDASGRLIETPLSKVHADIRALQARLQAWGIAPGMRVGILAENSYQVVLHDLALLALGAVSVFFSETQASVPTEELARDYGLSLLVASPRMVKPWPAACRWAVSIDGAAPGMVKRRAEGVIDDDRDLGSLIFSSGTTGRLKCMKTSRAGTEGAIAEFSSAYAFSARDRMLVFLPLSSFQQRVMIYCAVAAGMELVVADPQRVFHAFRNQRPTVVCAPPMLWEGICERAASTPLLDAKIALLRRVPSLRLRRKLAALLLPRLVKELGGRLRVLMTGMAAIKPATHALFEALGAPLYEYYGLTECGNIALNSLNARRIGTVGKPVQPGCVVIADDNEVLVKKSFFVTKGYTVAGEEENARVYLGENLIATGDLGRLDPDGFLQLIGRKKEIIVTAGGNKISPEELELKLNRSPDIARGVVFGGDGIDGIVAVVSLHAPADSRRRERVKQHVDQLNAQSPSPYHITRLVFTDRAFDADSGLLTRNLKLNRRAIFEAFSPELTARS